MSEEWQSTLSGDEISAILVSYKSSMPRVVYESMVANFGVNLKSSDSSFDEIEFYTSCGVACSHSQYYQSESRLS